MFKIFLKRFVVFSFFLFISLDAYQIGSYSLKNNKGQNVSNEDRVVALDKEQLLKQKNDCDFFASVFDGHKGTKISDFMSKHVFNIFNEYVESEQVIEIALGKTFEEFNEATKNCFPGSTAVVCCKKSTNLYLANVGDSKAVLFGKNKTQETLDHKVIFSGCNINEEAKRIIRNGGHLACVYRLIIKETGEDKIYKQVFSFRNRDPKKYEIIWCDYGWNRIEENSDDMEIVKKINTIEEKDFFEEDISTEWYVYTENVENKGGLGMTRAFGDVDFKAVGVNAVPDILEWPLEAGDKYLVVATDGLWNGLYPDEVRGIIDGGILCGQNVEQITKRLCDESRNNGCIDDISVVLILFDESDFLN